MFLTLLSSPLFGLLFTQLNISCQKLILIPQKTPKILIFFGMRNFLTKKWSHSELFLERNTLSEENVRSRKISGDLIFLSATFKSSNFLIWFLSMMTLSKTKFHLKQAKKCRVHCFHTYSVLTWFIMYGRYINYNSFYLKQILLLGEVLQFY